MPKSEVEQAELTEEHDGASGRQEQVRPPRLDIERVHDLEHEHEREEGRRPREDVL
jgi:hypothetical protein